jgi:transcriptional regulator with XRE-family HTH domain
VPTLAAYPGMMQRARKREGLRICRAAWLVGVSVHEYREIEAGDRTPSPDTYQRIAELYGWPQTFVGERPEPSCGAAPDAVW